MQGGIQFLEVYKTNIKNPIQIERANVQDGSIPVGEQNKGLSSR